MSNMYSCSIPETAQEAQSTRRQELQEGIHSTLPGFRLRCTQPASCSAATLSPTCRTTCMHALCAVKSAYCAGSFYTWLL